MSLTPGGNEPQHPDDQNDLTGASIDLPLVSTLSVAAVERYLEVLRSDPDQHSRRFAARRLGESGNARAVEALIDALRADDAPLVKRESAEALGKLGLPQGRMALIEALNDCRELVIQSERNVIRYTSISALAARALTQLPPPSGTEITALCSHLPFVPVKTQMVLFEILGKAHEATPGALALMKQVALYSMDPYVRGSAVRGLEGVLGEKAVDLFERVAKSWFSRRQTKEFALYSLGLFASPIAQRRIAGILEPFVERAAEKLASGSPESLSGTTLIGKTAVDALARLPIELSLDPLLRHLGKRNAVLDCSIEGHLVALCASGAHIGPRLQQELDDSLANPGRTAALIRILSALHDTEAIACVVDVLGIEFPQTQKRLVYGAIASTVSSNRTKVDDSTVRSLRDFAGSEDPVTAEYAIVALSRLSAHAQSSLILLRRFLKPNEDSNVARAACTALGELKLRAAIPDLEAVLKNPFMPPMVAEAARRALERLVE